MKYSKGSQLVLHFLIEGCRPFFIQLGGSYSYKVWPGIHNALVIILYFLVLLLQLFELLPNLNERASESSFFEPLCNILGYWHFLGALVELMLDFFVRPSAY